MTNQFKESQTKRKSFSPSQSVHYRYLRSINRKNIQELSKNPNLHKSPSKYGNSGAKAHKASTWESNREFCERSALATSFRRFLILCRRNPYPNTRVAKWPGCSLLEQKWPAVSGEKQFKSKATARWRVIKQHATMGKLLSASNVSDDYEKLHGHRLNRRAWVLGDGLEGKCCLGRKKRKDI